MGIINVTRGVLNGVGDALFAMINGVVEIITRIALPVLLTMIPVLHVWGIWWAVGLVWMISGLACLMRYFSWRKKNAI